MVGNENLWPIRENIFQADNFNFNAVIFAKKPTPESGYLVREITTPIKKPYTCGQQTENYG